MNEKCWYLYILKCADDSFYTGVTNNLDNRLLRHNQGKGAKYTRSRLPCKMIYQECFESRSSALKREFEVKALSRHQKENLVQES